MEIGKEIEIRVDGRRVYRVEYECDHRLYISVETRPMAQDDFEKRRDV